MYLNPEIVRQQIANLLLVCPELGEDDVLRADMIEGETEAFDFLSRLVKQIEDSKILSEGTAARIDELRQRKDRFERRQESLRSLAFKIMQAAELKKAELALATLSIRNGTQKVVITNEDALPAECLRMKWEPDKTKIKELLVNGSEVQGAELSNAEPTLSIRIK